MTTLRLMSYNVRSLRDDGEAVARVIRDAQPHVVCVQEAPRLLRWRAKCAALARRSGLVVLTGGRTAAGNLLLCDIGVDAVSTADLLLSPRPGLHQRGAAVAVCRHDGVRFAVAGTHLDLLPDPRREHAAELLARLPSVGVPADLPLIVAGDLNDEPDGETWAVFATGRTDTFAAAGEGDGRTFKTADPNRRIDGIFAGPGVTVRSCTVLDGPDVRRASDHFPLLAELDLPG